MLNKFIDFSRTPWYWLALIVTGLSMETVALYYQYALDLGPCVNCIYIRIWLMGMILVSALGLCLGRIHIVNALMYGINTGLAYGMLQTSLELLGTERHTIFGSCGMLLGLPSWFALDEWFPTLFAVWEACGDTPELLFGITMAEALTALSWVLLFSSAGLLLLQLAGIIRSHQS